MTNLSNLFPWLSIRSKLLIAFAGLSILPLIFIGAYGIVSNVRTMQDIALENLSHDVLTYGADYFFLKPLDLDKLREAVRRCLKLGKQ
jgi:hypothetical protein